MILLQLALSFLFGCFTMFLIIRRYFSASSPRNPLFKNKSSKASVISKVLRREEAEMIEEDDEDERLLSSMTRNSESKNGSILKSRLSDEMKLVLLIRTDINMVSWI